FIMTRYGSIIFEKRRDDQRTVAINIPAKVPMIKPSTVSKSVTSTWTIIDPSIIFPNISLNTLDGELNNSGSTQYIRLAISHNAKKPTSMTSCQLKTIFFSFFKRDLYW